MEMCGKKRSVCENRFCVQATWPRCKRGPASHPLTLIWNSAVRCFDECVVDESRALDDGECSGEPQDTRSSALELSMFCQIGYMKCKSGEVLGVAAPRAASVPEHGF